MEIVQHLKVRCVFLEIKHWLMNDDVNIINNNKKMSGGI